MSSLCCFEKPGLITSTRGAPGGCFLSRPASEITAGEVFHALEGPLAVVSCVGEDVEGNCERRDSCGSDFIWNEVQQAVREVLDKYTVADPAASEAE